MDAFLGNYFLISQLANRCIQNSLFRIGSFAYLHALVHEMGHAAAVRFLYGQSPQIVILKTGGGYTRISRTLSPWRETIVNASGPLGNIAFSFCQLVGVSMLKKILPRPVSIFLATGALLWIIGEFLYACASISENNGGDFDHIAQKGVLYLSAAATALFAETLLGTLFVLKTLRNYT